MGSNPPFSTKVIILKMVGPSVAGTVMVSDTHIGNTEGYLRKLNEQKWKQMKSFTIVLL